MATLREELKAKVKVARPARAVVTRNDRRHLDALVEEHVQGDFVATVRAALDAVIVHGGRRRALRRDK